MNKALFLFMLCFLTAILPAEAPELRTVMPNSWRLITRLPPDEEAAFLRDNGGLVGATERELPRFMEYPFYNSSFQSMEGETRVYQEQIGEDTFYRLITPNSDSPDFSGQRGLLFVQTLVYEHRGRMVILGIAPYNSYVVAYSAENTIIVSCRSLDIIRAGGRARGVLATLMAHNGLESPRMVKGQIQGENMASYILLEDTLRVLDGDPAAPGKVNFSGTVTGLYRYEGAPYIWIEGSMCLVDPAVPLRYSLQNAFDGDPATSFVENTGHDLMNISLSGPNLIFGASGKRMAIINGYAQSMALYRSNNRVRTISTIINNAPVRVELLDDCLSWQFVEGAIAISVADIYPGERYNDTCIAEYNVYTDGYGWLFGDVDE